MGVGNGSFVLGLLTPLVIGEVMGSMRFSNPLHSAERKAAPPARPVGGMGGTCESP